MQSLHKNRAKQLYKALRSRGLTWYQDIMELLVWAEHFRDLENQGIDPKRLQRVLDWYCKEGMGAIYVPLAGNASTFCRKFEQIEGAKDRSKGQTLQYFDDVMEFDYDLVANERQACLYKVAQIVQFVDDLAHGRVKLPRKSRVGKTKLKKPMTVYLCLNTEVIDLMDWAKRLRPNPQLDLEFAKYLKQKGWFKRVNKHFAKPRTD